jgi:hypothetical protein
VYIYIYISFQEYGATYEKMWKNMAQPDRPQMAIKHGAKKCESLAG